MPLMLYAHPFSSYCQKVLIALYENDTGFTLRLVNDEQGFAELKTLWPYGKFPLLMDGNTRIVESSIIIEYLELHYPGPAPLLPRNPETALDTRFMDRLFDNYVMTPMQKIVGDALRVQASRDPAGVADARAQLEISYSWLDSLLQNRPWAAGERFSLADCAAAPSLFYADWAHEIDHRFANLRAYRARLLARPSIARVVDEARAYRGLFPLGAPDRD
jgi:glutathione S-transferase